MQNLLLCSQLCHSYLYRCVDVYVYIIQLPKLVFVCTYMCVCAAHVYLCMFLVSRLPTVVMYIIPSQINVWKLAYGAGRVAMTVSSSGVFSIVVQKSKEKGH